MSFEFVIILFKSKSTVGETNNFVSFFLMNYMTSPMEVVIQTGFPLVYHYDFLDTVFFI